MAEGSGVICIKESSVGYSAEKEEAEGNAGDKESQTADEREDGAAMDELEDGAAMDDLEDGATMDDLEDGAAMDELEDGATMDDLEDGAAMDDLEDGAAMNELENGAPKVISVDEAVEQIGCGFFQILITFFSGYMRVAVAIEVMVLAVLSPAIKTQWDVSSSEGALLTSMIFVGTMIGSVFWGPFFDAYGRKTLLMVCNAGLLVFGLLTAVPVSPSKEAGYPWLVVTRTAVGFMHGGSIQMFGCGWLYFGIVLLTTTLLQYDAHCGFVVNNSSNSSAALTSSDYLKIAWSAAAEIPGLIFTVLIIDRLGRKKTMIMEFVIEAGVILLLLICTSSTVLTVFLFIARGIMSGVFMAAFVYTPEVYPTRIRAVAMGVHSTASRIGAIVSPFAAEVLIHQSEYATISLFAASAFVFALMAAILPIETAGKPLKDRKQ